MKTLALLLFCGLLSLSQADENPIVADPALAPELLPEEDSTTTAPFKVENKVEAEALPPAETSPLKVSTADLLELDQTLTRIETKMSQIDQEIELLQRERAAAGKAKRRRASPDSLLLSINESREEVRTRLRQWQQERGNASEDPPPNASERSALEKDVLTLGDRVRQALRQQRLASRVVPPANSQPLHRPSAR